jgi:uncharacterized glyoxalase superfamily protein PhnB
VFSIGSANKHIAWIEKALGGKKEMVMPDHADKTKVMHASVQLNGGPVYFSDRFGNYGAPDANEPASRGTQLYLGFDSLEEADKIWKSAVKNKGKVHMAFVGQVWGSHYGVVEDPFGTSWAISAPSNGDNDNEESLAKKNAKKSKSPRTKTTSKIPQQKKRTSKRAKK